MTTIVGVNATMRTIGIMAKMITADQIRAGAILATRYRTSDVVSG